MATAVTVSLVKLLKVSLQYFAENINGEQLLCSKTFVRQSVLHMSMANSVQKTYKMVFKIHDTCARAAMAVVYLVEVINSYAMIFYQDHVLRGHLYCLPIVECLRVVSRTSPISRMNQNIYIHCRYIKCGSRMLSYETLSTFGCFIY